MTTEKRVSFYPIQHVHSMHISVQPVTVIFYAYVTIYIFSECELQLKVFKFDEYTHSLPHRGEVYICIGHCVLVTSTTTICIFRIIPERCVTCLVHVSTFLKYWLIEHWFSLTRSHSITRVPNNLFNRDAFLLLGPAFFVMKRDWCEQK